MATQFDQAIRSALRLWTGRIRTDLNLPVSVCWHEGGDGGEWVPLGDFDEPLLRVEIMDRHGAAAMLNPTLDSLGEAYVEGHLNIEGSVDDILAVAHSLSRGNAEAESGREPLVEPEGKPVFVERASWLQRVMGKVSDLGWHTRSSDAKAIAYHYDVSNDFYAQWLDPAMVYSCAYFERGDETLAEAQLKKIDHILTKLQLASGHTLLDIGCGWGALVIRAAQRFDVHCVGVTLSQNQYELARERVAAAGLSDRVEIRLQDYRDIPEQFDRISSVGMFEHVGLQNLVPYFRRIHDLLKPGGWALNHGITSSDAFNRETSYGGGRFIDKYVFPDGELPHIGTVLTNMQLGGLEAIDVEGLRRHYARTLDLWSEGFEARSDQLRSMVDERTWRIWRVYLAGCAWAFEHDEISIYQVLCCRAGASAQRLPWSRCWMYR